MKEEFDLIKNLISEKGVKNRSELFRKHSGMYNKFFKNLSKEEKDLLLPSTYPSYSHLNTKDDFKNFIEDNNITSRVEFGLRFSSGYLRFLSLLNEEEKDELLPRLLEDCSSINTYDDIKKFILDNGITTRLELFKRSKPVYFKFRTRLSEEEKKELLPSLNRDYSDINSVEEFRLFIEENSITSRIDFYHRFRNCYYKFLLLSEEERNNLLPMVNSSGELYLSELFTKNGIEFITEKTFPDLINVLRLRYDFFLPKHNILIEYHGSQHFDENDRFHDVEAIKRDKQKFEYAKKNNIPLLYFTNEINVYNRFGYFTEVITDSDILLQKIKEISLTN